MRTYACRCSEAPFTRGARLERVPGPEAAVRACSQCEYLRLSQPIKGTLYSPCSLYSSTNTTTVQLCGDKPSPHNHAPPVRLHRRIPTHHAHRHASAHALANTPRRLHLDHLRVRATPAHPHPARLQHRHLPHRLDFHLRATEPAVARAAVVEHRRDHGDRLRTLCAR